MYLPTLLQVLLPPAGDSHSTNTNSSLHHSLHTVTVNEFRLSQETTKTDSAPKFKMFKCLKIIIISFLITVILLFTIASIRTLSLDVNVGLQLARWEKTNNISLVIDHHQREELLAHFKGAIRIPTVSFSEKESNATALREFDRFLRKAFPTVFSSSLVRHELVANYSHLFSVQGSQPDLLPYLLLAHIDVVPASESDGWEAPPFSAKEIDGFIYGRGTIDDKGSLMGILQALEYLLIKGYAPRRGFYVGLGHDEEVSGYKGAMNIVRVLKQRSVQLLFVLDEGLAVLDGVISGLEGPAALIGISEKGSATVKLSVSMRPGHSSMPPSESSIGILAAAVKRLEENPMPRLFGHGPERGTFEHLAHKFGLPMKFIMSNLWLFAPLLGRVLERKPDTNAFVRTTTAVTMFNAGVKVNVIPALAEAYVNLRIHSAQSLQEVLDLIQSAVGDQRVKIELVNGFDPLPVSSADEKSFGFQIIKKTVLDTFPTVTVAPGICIGNTDSRHFKDLTNDIYRFAPIWFKPGDAQRFHGINERISKKNYEELIEFYFSLIQNSDIQKLPEPHSSVHEL
ncbi:N-fatty-acyl-amino acid synthase/hydrolase PM20D1.2 [Etheostoma spectabile]|nr:N-fatty-acyl-amino acid synthase/hydrolase PM20D1 [Etheostoma spectabile]